MTTNIEWEATIPDAPFRQSRIWKVVASAGCGKSYQIERTIKDLVFKDGVDPANIMYLVFNKKPADAFVAELAEAGIEDAPWVGTHHAVCRKLMKVKVLSGKDLVTWSEGARMTLTDEEEQGETRWDSVFRDLTKKIYEGDTKLDPLEQRFLDALRQDERENNRFTHIRYMQLALQRQLFPHNVEYVFIDEAQDNGKIQLDYFEHLKTLPQLKGLMIVGDDKQAINLFKGGRWDLFLNFEADRYVCLGKTYRNAPAILTFANKIASPIKKRSPLTTESAASMQGNVSRCLYLENAVRDIQDGIKQKKSVFILTRNKMYLKQVYGVLANIGIPYESIVLDRMLHVFYAMRALAEKMQEGKFSLSDLLQVLPPSEPMDGDLNKTAYWKAGVIEKFKKGEYDLDKADEVDLRVAYEHFQAGYDVPDLMQFGFSPRFIEDVLATLENKIPKGKGIWRGAKNDDRVRAIENYIMRYGLNFGRVTVSHIHPIKGGEADMVVLIKNITPAVHRTEMSDPDEERRVWYVAATRARERLIITQVYNTYGEMTRLL